MTDDTNAHPRIQRLFDALLVAVALASLVGFAYAWALADGHALWSRILMVVTGILAVGFACTLALPPWLRINLGLTTVVVGVSLIAANAVIEFTRTSEQALRVAAAERHGVIFDQRSVLDLVDELQGAGHEAFPLVFPVMVVDDQLTAFGGDGNQSLLPLGGISGSTTVFCNEAGQYNTFISDRYGFNNDDRVYDYDVPPVLVIGDSFAQGWCMEQGKDVPSLLRRRGINVINLGMAGNGPLLELATLKEYGPHFEPQAILWMYFDGNDLAGLQRRANHPLLTSYLNDDFTQNLVERQHEVDAFWEGDFRRREELRMSAYRPKDLISWRNLLTLYALRSRLGLVRQNYSGGALDLFRSTMTEAKATAETLGAPLYFVYLPENQAFLRGSSPTRDMILRVIDDLDIPLIDFQEALLASGDPMQYFPYRLGYHYNIEGYALLAEQILEQGVAPEGSLTAGLD